MATVMNASKRTSAKNAPALVLPTPDTAPLEKKITAWEHEMISALMHLGEAQTQDAHAQFAVNEARIDAERRIRLAAQSAEKKPTEAAIDAAVAADANVVTCEYQALEKRIALKAAESTVEIQKIVGRTTGWLVQLHIHSLA